MAFAVCSPALIPPPPHQAQPPAFLSADEACSAGSGEPGPGSAPSPPSSQQSHGGRPSEAEHTLFSEHLRQAALWPLRLQKQSAILPPSPSVCCHPLSQGAERDAPAPSSAQPICVALVSGAQTLALTLMSLSLRHRSHQNCHKLLISTQIQGHLLIQWAAGWPSK